MEKISPVKEGWWSFYSKKDPRWHGGGKAIVGGFVQPRELIKKIEDLAKKYGTPPDDLEWSITSDDGQVDQM